MSEEQVISDPSDLRKYRTELPNLYDDSGLNLFEYRLLGHYKRVGKCTESIETTAKKCGMSEGKVSETRMSLKENGWITLERVAMDNGENGRYRFVVRVVDRWIENFARYSGLSPDEIAEQLKKASPSPREGSPSPREGKKELFKNLRDDIRFSEIAKKLESLTGGLNSSSADLISTWLEKHSNEWIIKAIEIAKDKGARHQNYVDATLIGWEAKGYPQSREEKIQEAKNRNSRSTSSKKNNQPGLSADDVEKQKQTARERMQLARQKGAMA